MHSCLDASVVRLCHPMECSPPDSSVHEVLQARRLEWTAIPSSRDGTRPGMEPVSPALQVGPLPTELPGASRDSDSCKREETE